MADIRPNPVPSEEQWASPADRIKEMILKRWDEAENLFTNGDDIFYSRATKSFKRMFFVMADKEERDILNIIDDNERKDITNIREKHLPLKEEEDTIRKVQYSYAEIRMEVLVMMMGQSPVVQKDVDVEFVMPETMEGCEEIRKLVRESMTKQETDLARIRALG